MKKILTYFSSAILLAAVMVSSMGVTINKHVCYSSGIEEVSLLPIKHCEEKKTAQPKSSCCTKDMVESETATATCHAPATTSGNCIAPFNCCDYTAQYLKIDVVKYGAENFTFFKDFTFQLVADGYSLLFHSAKFAHYPVQLNDGAPPSGGRSLLSLLRVLRL